MSGDAFDPPDLRKPSYRDTLAETRIGGSFFFTIYVGSCHAEESARSIAGDRTPSPATVPGRHALEAFIAARDCGRRAKATPPTDLGTGQRRIPYNAVEREIEGDPPMSEIHTGDTPVNLGAAMEIARRLVDQGRFESISEACREGLRRLDGEQRIVDTLVGLGEQGMGSGVAEGFDIDEFIEEIRARGGEKSPTDDDPVPSAGPPLYIRGSEGMVVDFGKCCHPIPGDSVMGFVSTGRGIVIHTTDCKNFTEFSDRPERWEAPGVRVSIRREAWGTVGEFIDPHGNRCSLRDEGSFIPSAG